MSGAGRIACGLALLACACSKPKDEASEAGQAAPAPAPAPACGRILFAIGEAEARVSVGVVDASGGALAVLSDDETASVFPAGIAPDGSAALVLRSETLASGKTRDRLGVVALDGEVHSPRHVGPSDAALRNPSWAPDGSFVVFESDAHSFRDLYRLQLAGGAPLRLTDNPEGNFEPEVSPDGQAIVFVSSRDGNAEIYRMTADGGSPRRLTTSPGDDVAPRGSPDGRTIAFVSARDRARGLDVYLLPAEGGEARPAVGEARESAILARDLAWSPDGARLAFTQLTPKAGDAQIVIVAVETGEVVARSPGEGTEQQPSWSPDGEQLVFARGGAGGSTLVRMGADGGAATVITEAGQVHWLPRWIASEACPRIEPARAPASHGGQG